jgi:hypothetical protein
VRYRVRHHPSSSERPRLRLSSSSKSSVSRSRVSSAVSSSTTSSSESSPRSCKRSFVFPSFLSLSNPSSCFRLADRKHADVLTTFVDRSTASVQAIPGAQGSVQRDRHPVFPRLDGSDDEARFRHGQVSLFSFPTHSVSIHSRPISKAHF